MGSSSPVNDSHDLLTVGFGLPKRVQISTEVETVEASPEPHLQLGSPADSPSTASFRPSPGALSFSPRISSRRPPPVVTSTTSSPAHGPVLPGVAMRKVRMALCTDEDDEEDLGRTASSPVCRMVSVEVEAAAEAEGGRRFACLALATPSSCKSAAAYRYTLTPRTPDPARDGFRFIDSELDVVFFDFDGTLTATPGTNTKQHGEKKAELKDRADMLRPRLGAMVDAGLLLGILSKSTESTIREALEYAGLSEFFQGPIVGKAVDLEGKAGIISKLHQRGQITLGPDGLGRVLLIDDDVHDLDRCKEKGIQTFAAPEDGGLLACDFDEIFACLCLPWSQ